jgi:hypothetical protein
MRVFVSLVFFNQASQARTAKQKNSRFLLVKMERLTRVSLNRHQSVTFLVVQHRLPQTQPGAHNPKWMQSLGILPLLNELLQIGPGSGK